MTEPLSQSNLGFRLMSLMFCVRDWLRPPTRILQKAGVRPGMAVLDFGCGPGGFSLAAASYPFKAFNTGVFRLRAARIRCVET